MSDNIIETFKPDVVGGQYLVQIRAQFNKDDRNIIVASNRHVLQYDADSCNLMNRIMINEIETNHLEEKENEFVIKIVSCERIEDNLYIFTTNGKVLIWNLDTQDWINELSLPLEEGEELVCCKLISKRQYLYSVSRLNDSAENDENNENDEKNEDGEVKKKEVDNLENNLEPRRTINLYYSMSRSERERPKHREDLGKCSTGQQNTFDIGCLNEFEFSSDNTLSQSASQESIKSTKKSAKQRIVTFIDKGYVFFQKVAIGEKLTIDKFKQRASVNLTCVRANAVRPMVATGDLLGRIYIYTGDYENKINRTKLHWHSMPVNDLAYSSTGNTLFSVGGESGCVVVWDMSQNHVGQKRVIARLGMPIRHVNCGYSSNQLILGFEDNEIQIMDTNERSRKLRTFTRRTIDMYKENDHKALRIENCSRDGERHKSIGLLWDSKTDTVLTNARTGWLQFYSPREQARVQCLDFLKSSILTIEMTVRVTPSDITKATITDDGNWLALYETREADDTFPNVKLHIWQRMAATGKWVWIQTAERVHSCIRLADLKFSPDGQFLISVGEDGTFHVLHRISFDSKAEGLANNKQMYAKGFAGNVPPNLPSMATFSQDSSVLAMSLKNDTTLIWMIVDPYKLVYECQLNQMEETLKLPLDGNSMDTTEELKPPNHEVLGLHFGFHDPTQSLAPLCEVRTSSIRLWNILNPIETMEYVPGDQDELTSAAFDLCSNDDKSLNHFAVATKRCHINIFQLGIDRTSTSLKPLITISCALPSAVNNLSPPYYTHMCFVERPILEMDTQCYQDKNLVKLLNRLCLMTSYQELVAVTDKLTLGRQSAMNSCNKIKSIDISELQTYFAKSSMAYTEESAKISEDIQRQDSKFITEKQRRIRNRLDIQRMIKDLLYRVPSQNLPSMKILGPMIIDKLV